MNPIKIRFDKLSHQKLVTKPWLVVYLNEVTPCTSKGCRFNCWSGRIQEAAHRCFLSHIMFPFLSLSLSLFVKINKHILR